MNAFKSWIEKTDLFTLCWIALHTIMMAVWMVIIFISLCSLGGGIGINPPIDIHPPTADEIKEHIQGPYDPDGEFV